MMWICGILAAGSLVVLAVTFAVAARRPSPSHAEPPPLEGAGGTHGGPAD